MASFTCHVVGVAKRVRLERIVMRQGSPRRTAVQRLPVVPEAGCNRKQASDSGEAVIRNRSRPRTTQSLDGEARRAARLGRRTVWKRRRRPEPERSGDHTSETQAKLG